MIKCMILPSEHLIQHPSYCFMQFWFSILLCLKISISKLVPSSSICTRVRGELMNIECVIRGQPLMQEYAKHIDSIVRRHAS